MEKYNVLLSMHSLTLETLFDHAGPAYTCEMFSFTGMIQTIRKFALILPGTHSSFHRKKGGKVRIFS